MKYKALLLDGSHTGKMVETEVSCTEEELQEVKDKMIITYEGIRYAGYCRCCGSLVRKGEESYIDNIDGLGILHVDVFHRYCL